MHRLDRVVGLAVVLAVLAVLVWQVGHRSPHRFLDPIHLAQALVEPRQALAVLLEVLVRPLLPGWRICSTLSGTNSTSSATTQQRSKLSVMSLNIGVREEIPMGPLY